MTDAGHPSRHGFKRCARCGAWRREEGVAPLHWGDGTPAEGDVVACVDSSVCTRLAGVGTGRLDVVGYDANGAEVAS
jgi:hypothetical protein